MKDCQMLVGTFCLRKQAVDNNVCRCGDLMLLRLGPYGARCFFLYLIFSNSTRREKPMAK